jgi:hypothetical protein
MHCGNIREKVMAENTWQQQEPTMWMLDIILFVGEGFLKIIFVKVEGIKSQVGYVYQVCE